MSQYKAKGRVLIHTIRCEILQLLHLSLHIKFLSIQLNDTFVR